MEERLVVTGGIGRARTCALLALSVLMAADPAAAETEAAAGGHDTTTPNRRFLIRPYTGTTSLDVTFQSDAGREVELAPNKPLFVGLKLGYKGFVIWGSTTVLTENEATYGESQSFDLQGGKGFRVKQRELFLDGFMQWYRGYYVENSKAIEPTMTGYLVHPDMSGFTLGIAGIYYLNPSFSHETTFSEMRHSPKSGGSWLIRGSLGAQGIASDDGSPFLPAAVRTEFGELASIHAFRSRFISLSAGYAYDWRIGHNLLLSGSLSLGVSAALSTYRILDRAEIWEGALGSSGSVLMAFGYAGETFHGGITASYHVEGMQAASVDVEFTRFQLLLLAGARI